MVFWKARSWHFLGSWMCFWYSHATWRWARALETLPPLLVARHQYSPLSACFLLCWARRKNRPLSGSRILKRGVNFALFSSSNIKFYLLICHVNMLIFKTICCQVPSILGEISNILGSVFSMSGSWLYQIVTEVSWDKRHDTLDSVPCSL